MLLGKIYNLTSGKRIAVQYSCRIVAETRSWPPLFTEGCEARNCVKAEQMCARKAIALRFGNECRQNNHEMKIVRVFSVQQRQELGKSQTTFTPF